MTRLIKVLFAMVILGLVGLTGYAYVADLSPAQTEVRQPVILNAD
jgi:hypothetical protein